MAESLFPSLSVSSSTSSSASPSEVCTTGRESLARLQQNPEAAILIKFVAPYCPGCETLAPILQQLAIAQQGKLHLVSIDIVEDPELAMQFEIRSAPTVVACRGETVVDRVVGLKPKQTYVNLIESIGATG